MALIRIAEEDRSIRDPDEVRRFLAPFGIFYERQLAEGRLPADTTPGLP